jgi:hypothetical protein
LNAPKWTRRTVYVAAVVAMIASTSGFALASVLSSTGVSQGSSYYQGGNTGALGYSTPTLTSTYDTFVSGCAVGPFTDPASAGTVNAIVSAWKGGVNCTQGNFVEEFSFSFSETIVTQKNVFTISTTFSEVTGTQFANVTVTLGTGTSSAFTATVNIYVVYSPQAPATISTLDVLVHS